MPDELPDDGQRGGRQLLRRQALRGREELDQILQRQRAAAAREQSRGQVVDLVLPARPVGAVQPPDGRLPALVAGFADAFEQHRAGHHKSDIK